MASTSKKMNQKSNADIFHKVANLEDQVKRLVKVVEQLRKQLHPKHSHYIFIDGHRLKRSLYEKAKEFEKYRISLDEAKKLFEMINEDNKFTSLEYNTMLYIMSNLKITEPARKFMIENMKNYTTTS